MAYRAIEHGTIEKRVHLRVEVGEK